MRRFLTVQAYAEFEGKHEDTIYRWIHEGKLDGTDGKPRAEKNPGGYGWRIVISDPEGVSPI